MLIEPFSTRLYQFDNAFGMSEERNDVLINVLNTIKETSEHAAGLIPEKEYGPTYKTNFHIRDLSDYNIFEPIVQILNQELEQYGTYFEFVNPPWYSEYGPHDWHEPHNHDMKEINIMQLGNAFKYSCIINLSMIGETAFLNPYMGQAMVPGSKITWQMVFILYPIPTGKSTLTEIFYLEEPVSIFDGIQTFLLTMI